MQETVYFMGLLSADIRFGYTKLQIIRCIQKLPEVICIQSGYS